MANGEVRLNCLPDGVYVLTFSGGDGQHRLDLDNIAAIHTALDTVEKDPNASALVTTSEDKFYCTGIDMCFVEKNRHRAMELLQSLMNLLSRMLTFPMPTVAAINGHAIGGGFMFALAHDYRFMQLDRGLMFMNEVNLKMPLVPGAMAIIRCKMACRSFQKAVLTGHRFNGEDAEEHGFIDKALLNLRGMQEAALTKAKELALKQIDRDTYQILKVIVMPHAPDIE